MRRGKGQRLEEGRSVERALGKEGTRGGGQNGPLCAFVDSAGFWEG